jgi:large subunit ribosomal protein L3
MAKAQTTTSPYRMGLLGKKLGMTQIFTDQGDCIGVTVVQASPCVVVSKRTPERDGYAALQLGIGERPRRVVNKPELGHFGKGDVAPQRFVREIRCDAAELDKFEVGKPVDLKSVFKEGDYIDVVGTSKGKGFQGVMKRHRMPGFRATHGTHEFFRHGGSIGCRLTPGRVHRGKRMGGHMGDVRKTVQNLVVMKILDQEGLLLIRGAVPGGKNGFLVLSAAQKRLGKTWRPRQEQQEVTPKNPLKASKAGVTTKKAK